MKRLKKILKVLLLVTVIAAALILTAGCASLSVKATKLLQSTDIPIYTFVPTQTDAATALPDSTPTAVPAKPAAKAPTAVPTRTATKAPTAAPTAVPTAAPTAVPTQAPTAAPTQAPTAVPTQASAAAPTKAPTAAPTKAPTAAPTKAPAAAPTKAPEPEITTPYVGNANSKVFHSTGCSSVRDMKAKNRVPLSSRESAIERGYKPCQRCNP